MAAIMGHHKRRNFISSLLLLVLLTLIKFGNSFDISLSGVVNAIKGDFEKFTCEIKGLDRAGADKYSVTWKFKYDDFSEVAVHESEMLNQLGVRNRGPESLSVTSFILLNSTDLIGIICESNPKFESRTHSVTVRALPVVSSEDEPCELAERTNKPIAMIQLSTLDLLAPYRKSYYSDGNTVSINFPGDVSQIKLICYSYGSSESDEPPKWSLPHSTYDKNIKFASWALPPKGNCKGQIFEIFQVYNPGTITAFCRAGSEAKRSKSVQLDIELSDPRRHSDSDMNATANCINDIVDKFYDKELTGVGVGGSLAIILMMVGIAVLRKQLNQQKEENKNLQARSAEAGGAGGSSSTEKLRPQEASQSNNNP